jgi:hypothetical protein
MIFTGLIKYFSAGIALRKSDSSAFLHVPKRPESSEYIKFQQFPLPLIMLTYDLLIKAIVYDSLILQAMYVLQ